MPAPGARKRKRQQNGAASMPLLPPEVSEDEIEISEDDIEFVRQNKSYAGFVTGLNTKEITKQVLGLKPDWDGDDLERFYEKKMQQDSFKKKKMDDGSVEPVDVLPVKTLDGKLEYRKPEKKPKNEEDDQTEKGESDKAAEKKSKKARKQKKEDVRKSKKQPVIHDQQDNQQDDEAVHVSVEKNELEAFISTEERRMEMKAKIAELATGLLSSPEESIAALKELLALCSDKDETVAQLATLSAMAVFKDILPGYRIRLPTEKELQVQVSKDVKKVRDYETALLKNYQGYVKGLIKTRKASYQHVALRCMCGLLEAVPHFNLRENLLRAVIPFMNSGDPQLRQLVCTAMRSIFKNEGKHGGEATVEAVQLIADFVKLNNCVLHSDVLEVFLGLKFDEDITRNANEANNGKELRNDRPFKSKREEKKAKRKAMAAEIQTEVEEDFREASSQLNAAHRKKLQTLTLSAVFETYFRVLKTAFASLSEPDNSHPLLEICLKGLLKFSHLISIDFLGDLMAILRKLAEGSLAVEERLQCCIAALQIMKANMEALTVDLKEFYVQFYKILLELSPDRDMDSEARFAEALEVLLCETRHHDMQRVAAFIKRLGAISLHLSSAATIAALITIRKLMLRYKQSRNMLENDGGGGGPGGASATVFQLDGTDPDQSGALSSVVWELSLLEKHYNPEVAKLSRQVSIMLTSEAFDTFLSPRDAIVAYSTQQGGFRPPVKQPASKLTNKAHYTLSGRASDVHADVADEAGVGFQEYFRLVRGINENQKLRKEQLRCKSRLELYERYRASKVKKLKTKSQRYAVSMLKSI